MLLVMVFVVIFFCLLIRGSNDVGLWLVLIHVRNTVVPLF